MVTLAKPRGDRIVLYNFNGQFISNKSKELLQLKAIILTLPIKRDWKITKSLQLSEELSPETASKQGIKTGKQSTELL